MIRYYIILYYIIYYIICTLKVEAASSSETALLINQSTQRYISEVRNLHEPRSFKQLMVTQLAKKVFPLHYGIRKLIAASTCTRDSFVSQANRIHTLISHLRPILILSSHICLGLTPSMFHSSFPIRISHLFYVCYMSGP
jgi:hypothetical protein